MQRRPNVEDVGSTLYKCYTNILVFTGMCLYIYDATLYKHETNCSGISPQRMASNIDIRAHNNLGPIY